MSKRDFSNVIVMLARQRSGTHALLSVLQSHPQIFTVGEAFLLEPAGAAPQDQTNYFEFLKRHAGSDLRKLLAFDQEELFLAYLEYLRGFSPRPFLVLDVKINTTHHIARRFQSPTGPPYLLELILKHGLRTLLITRANYLRYYVSASKAAASGRWAVACSDSQYADMRIRLSVSGMLREFSRCQAEDRMIHQLFASASARRGGFQSKFRKREYAAIFSNPDGGIGSDFLRDFADWLGIANTFSGQCAFRKQSQLPLKDTIRNYNRVVRALRDTPYAYFLQDEESYREDGQAMAAGGKAAVASVWGRLLRRRPAPLPAGVDRGIPVPTRNTF